VLSRVKRVAASVSVGGFAVFGAMSTTAASPAVAASGWTVSGQITCADELQVDGPWIATASGSGWAFITHNYGYAVSFQRTLPRQEAWTVHVGCGVNGNGSWKYTPDSIRTTTNSSQSWTCYTPDVQEHVDSCQPT
jgi:hypothetical protein